MQTYKQTLNDLQTAEEQYAKCQIAAKNRAYQFFDVDKTGDRTMATFVATFNREHGERTETVAMQLALLPDDNKLDALGLFLSVYPLHEFGCDDAECRDCLRVDIDSIKIVIPQMSSKLLSVLLERGDDAQPHPFDDGGKTLDCTLLDRGTADWLADIDSVLTPSASESDSKCQICEDPIGVNERFLRCVVGDGEKSIHERCHREDGPCPELSDDSTQEVKEEDKPSRRVRRQRPANVKQEDDGAPLGKRVINADGSFDIMIKDLANIWRTMTVTTKTTGLDIKRFLFKKDIPDVSVIVLGRSLDDYQTLGRYNVGPDTSVRVHLRLRGGMIQFPGSPVPLQTPPDESEYMVQAKAALPHMPLPTVQLLLVQTGYTLAQVCQQGRALEQHREQMMAQGNQILAQLQQLQQQQQQSQARERQLQAEKKALGDENAKLKKQLRSAIPDPLQPNPKDAATARIIEHEISTYSASRKSLDELYTHSAALESKINTHRPKLNVELTKLRQLAAQKYAMKRIASQIAQRVQAKESAKDQMHLLRVQEQQIAEQKRKARAMELMGGVPSSGLAASASPMGLTAFNPPTPMSHMLLGPDEPEDSIDITHTDNEEETEDEETQSDRDMIDNSSMD